MGDVRSAMARLGPGVAAVGLATIVSGTLLPWLRSGVVLRDSYQAVGALRPLLDDGGWLGVALTGWLGIIPACAVCVALYVLGFRRSSGIGTMVVSVIVGTAAGAAAVQPEDTAALFAVAGTGPVVTLVGAAIALLGGVTVTTCPRGGQAAVRATVGGSS